MNHYRIIRRTHPNGKVDYAIQKYKRVWWMPWRQSNWNYVMPKGALWIWTPSKTRIVQELEKFQETVKGYRYEVLTEYELLDEKNT
jgi:hypothetical protein